MSPTPPTPQSDIPITPNHNGTVVASQVIGFLPSSSEAKIRKRSPNWLVQEEEQLASSWLFISQQPEFNGNPSGEAFFSRVADDFNRNSKFHHRDADQMKTRWGSLNTSTLKFSAIYNRIEQNPPSCTSHTDWVALAKQQYFEQNRGHTFKDEVAWERLRHAPKWKQQSTSAVILDFSKAYDPSLESSIVVGSSVVPMPAHCHHPMRSAESRRLKRRTEDEDEEDGLEDELQLVDQSTSWMSTEKSYGLNQSGFISEEQNQLIRRRARCDQELKKSQAQLNDLTVLKTSESDCPDEISKEALRLMKARIKRRYEKSEGTAD